MKNLDKFFNKANTPWVQLIWNNYYNNGKLPGYVKKGSFWWRDIIQLLNQYKGLASPAARCGSTIHLWEDLWGGCVPKLQYPELYSYTRCKNITLQRAAGIGNLEELFHLPISEEALMQLELLLDEMDNCLVQQGNAIWTYIWGAAKYTSKKAYKFMKDTGIFTLLLNGSGIHVLS